MACPFQCPLQRVAPLLGRFLLSFIFIFAGFGKLTHWGATAAEMATKGMPMVPFLLACTILIELVGGLMLLVGYRTRLVAAVFAAFLIPVTLIFHNFWAADAAHYQAQLTNFLKNMAIMGGMLHVVTFGAGGCSIDSRRGAAACTKSQDQ